MTEPSIYVAGDTSMLISPGNILFKVNNNTKSFIYDWYNYCTNVSKYKLGLSDALAINGLIENLPTDSVENIKKALRFRQSRDNYMTLFKCMHINTLNDFSKCILVHFGAFSEITLVVDVHAFEKCQYCFN